MIYGMTELTGAIFQSKHNECFSKTTTTVGCLADHLEAKIIDKNGFIVPLGTPGELCIRGYTTFLGYWSDKIKTKEILEDDGWLKTG